MMKKSGFTLVEILVGMTLMVIFMGFIFQFTQSIQLGEKRLRISKDFQGESRFLLDKMLSVTRGNTIDYDRYFKEIGPNVDDGGNLCPKFDDDQLPNLKDPTDSCDSFNNSSNCTNNATNRAKFSYPDIFYWDTNNDQISDRQLGGVTPNNLMDNCTIAFANTKINDQTTFPSSEGIDQFEGENPTLFLMSSDRSKRFAFRLQEELDICEESSDQKCKRLVSQIQIGADTNNDGIADLWAPIDQDQDEIEDPGDTQIVWESNNCQIEKIQSGTNELYPIIDLEINTAYKCLVAGNNWAPISLSAVDIESLNFTISPNKDPYLAFRDDSVQKHPKVTFNLSTRLKDPEKYSFELQQRPTLNLQTTISSRIYGDSRK